jgi:hypothetical protein
MAGLIRWGRHDYEGGSDGYLAEFVLLTIKI